MRSGLPHRRKKKSQNSILNQPNDDGWNWKKKLKKDLKQNK
jgi:hypothetical protein